MKIRIPAAYRGGAAPGSKASAERNSGVGFEVRGDGVLIGNYQVYFTSAEAHGNSGVGVHIDPYGYAIVNDCVFLVGGSPGNFSGLFNEGKVLTRGNNSIELYTGVAAEPLGP